MGARREAVGNLIHLLEAHGVRIYSLTHENTDLDAFSLYWHGQPFMFLGTEKSAERSRFDAAHELAHLVLHGEEREPLRRGGRARSQPVCRGVSHAALRGASPEAPKRSGRADPCSEATLERCRHGSGSPHQ